MAPTASIASPEMTQSDDHGNSMQPPAPVSPVAIVPREEPSPPPRRHRLSLPRQMQECTMQRILVTGGAGFIGIHLCRKLLEQGHEVICLDNLFTSQRANVLELQTQYPNFEFVRHDVTEPYACEVDQIYNLACPASPVHYQYNPIKTTKVSFLGAMNVLGLAKRVKARVFQASTSEVYGDPEVSPQVESYLGNVDCTGVRACYDEGKRVAETLFFEYHRT
ncbi:UDP-glucuronic acid decarboxylase 1, partial [Phytophthora palmivora]